MSINCTNNQGIGEDIGPNKFDSLIKQLQDREVSSNDDYIIENKAKANNISFLEIYIPTYIITFMYFIYITN